MQMVPIGFVHQDHLEPEVLRAKRKLDQDIVSVNYSIEPDSTGERSIYFRIVLTDDAAKEDRLWEVASRVRLTLLDEIHPLENWGLMAYFNFRSETEQQKSNDPEWK